MDPDGDGSHREWLCMPLKLLWDVKCQRKSRRTWDFYGERLWGLGGRKGIERYHVWLARILAGDDHRIATDGETTVTMCTRAASESLPYAVGSYWTISFPLDESRQLTFAQVMAVKIFNGSCGPASAFSQRPLIGFYSPISIEKTVCEGGSAAPTRDEGWQTGEGRR